VASGNLSCMVAVGLFSFGFPAADSLLETWGVISLITLRNLLGLLFLVGLMAFKLSVSSLVQLPWIKGRCLGPQPELNHPTQFEPQQRCRQEVGACSIDDSALALGSRSTGLGGMVQEPQARLKVSKWGTFCHSAWLQITPARFKQVYSDRAILSYTTQSDFKMKRQNFKIL